MSPTPAADWPLCRNDSVDRLTGFESGKVCNRVRPSPCFSRCGPRRLQCLERASCGRSKYETHLLASRICLSGWRDALRRGTQSFLSYHFILSSYLSFFLSFCRIREEKDLLKFSLLHLNWISYANKTGKLSHISVK